MANIPWGMVRKATRLLLRALNKGGSQGKSGDANGGSTQGAPSGAKARYLRKGAPLPKFDYAPARDGDADPGEVVWTWVPYEEDGSRGKDRPVLVLAYSGAEVICAQLTSKDHDRDAAQEARWGRYWMDIGTGNWDSKRRPSEVRLDRLLSVPQDAVRREGGRLNKHTYNQVVAQIQKIQG